MSTREAKDGLSRMPTGVANRSGFVRHFVIRGLDSRARTKTCHTENACKRARELELTDVLDRHGKDAT